MNNFILITLTGGLGNQMFGYAFYRKMCIEYPNIVFKLDVSDVWNPKYERNVELLHVFPTIEPSMASRREIFKVENKLTFEYRGKGSRILRKVIDYINQKITERKKHIRITEEKFQEYGRKIDLSMIENQMYFCGFWQNVDDYIKYIPILQKEFHFRETGENNYIKLRTKIMNDFSIGIHIRRGDYVGEKLDILDTQYYTKLIYKVLSENANGWFYFFSDDLQYVQREFAWLKNKTLVRGNEGNMSFRDMELLSLCKINIIANSTFSLWAALLNQNKMKKVYYPDHYMKNEEMQDIKLDNFYKVKVFELEDN